MWLYVASRDGEGTMNHSGKNETMMERQIASTLAASIVTSMGRPVSLQEVENIIRDVTMMMFPQPGSGAYKAWAANFDPTKRYE